MPKNKNGTLKRVFGYIGKYKLLLPVSMLFALVTVVTTLLLPLIIGNAIDFIVEGNVQMGKMGETLIYAVIVIGITAIAQWILTTVNNRITYNVARDIRRDAFGKIRALPISYLDSRSQGDLVNRIVNDTEQFSEGLLLGFTQLLTGVMTIVGTLVILFLENWIIAIVVVVLTPMSLFIAKFVAKKTYDMFKLQSKTKGEQTTVIDEMIGNLKVVKAFGHEDEAIEKFDEVNERLAKCSLRAIFFSSITNPSTRFVNNIVYAAVALTGAIMAINTKDAANPFTVGALSSLLIYATQYAKPFNEISGVVTEFQNSLACASRVFELVDETPETKDSDATLEGVSGNVKLWDVHFSYTPEKKLIENLSLEVKSGQRIAIVGPTGCGKTTIINLLMRFYDVDQGAISVEEQDIRTVSRRSLRKNYGMVLQDTWLSNDTIKENIKMGKPDATDEEVILAAKAAHAHSFIKRLKHGYDTKVGEGGGNLSQGQKQLICIARVMLALPPMLILDEATSSIDTRTEMKIQEAFATMMQGRTSFIVAHRLSTIKEADVILVMRDGHIVEKGAHRELLDKGGFYSELYNSQFAH